MQSCSAGGGLELSPLDVRLAQTAEEIDAALRLRERVFAGEQGVRPEADQDGRDHEASHLVAVEDGRVVGTCRLVFRGDVARLGRLAVERELRGRGLGAEILRQAEHEALAGGARLISLHAQLAARSLYVRDGYSERGPVFVEEGIDHVTMEKRIA
jgi:predicted GNAT family N-acyltransferase